MTPAVILPFIQRGSMDCGLCCVQMLVDRSYDQVRDVALRVVPRLHKTGMFMSELEAVAAEFGIRLRRSCAPRGLSDTSVAIVQVKLLTGGKHYVLFFRGVIVNPADGMIWDDDTYYKNNGQPRACLVVSD